MKKLTFYLSAVLLVSMMFFVSCAGGEDANTENTETTEVVELNEFDLLASYIEENGDFINSKKVPTMITAEKVEANLGETQLIIDMRSAKDFAVSGHIDGSLNMPAGEIFEYFMNNDTKTFEKVVLVCYSGQTASYVASILQMAGYSNAYVMKWGMSGWNPKFAKDKWLARASNKYADVLETTENVKAEAGEYPEIITGYTTGEEIFNDRAGKVLYRGFSQASVKIDDIMADPSSFYIVNYWPKNLYDKGHITGAVQYDPKTTLNRANFLSTLPTDKPVVVYCFTGQHAAFVAAYLNVLGYDARTISYGANSFMNQTMQDDEEIGHGFSKKASMNFNTVTSEYTEPEGGEEEVGGC